MHNFLNCLSSFQVMKKVKLPRDYFARAVRQDYADWLSAVPREFFQNSIDAGSRNIDFEVNTNHLKVTDDGCGMNERTLEDVLLKLLETDKGESHTGGFGRAKELLYFAWPAWKIRTRNLVAEGQYIDYTIRETSDFFQGTVSEVDYGESVEPGFVKALKDYVAKCSFDATVTCNQEPVKGMGSLSELNLIKESETTLFQYALYEIPVRGTEVYVRCNGLFMFSRPFRNDKGLIFEVSKGWSQQAFTANRDGFNSFWDETFNIAMLVEASKDGKLNRFQSPLLRPPSKEKFGYGEGCLFRGNYSWQAKDASNFFYDNALSGKDIVIDLQQPVELRREQTNFMIGKSADINKDGSLGFKELYLAYLGVRKLLESFDISEYHLSGVLENPIYSPIEITPEGNPIIFSDFYKGNLVITDF